MVNTIGLQIVDPEFKQQADPFSLIASRIMVELKTVGGKADYGHFERWAETNGIGKYTLRTVINDMVEDGMLRAPEGYWDDGEELEPPTPKVIMCLNISQQDMKKMKDYLLDYWSVGILRLFDDMNRTGMKDINEVLKALIQEGSAELAGLNVVNASGKLLKDVKTKKQSDISELVRL